MMPVFRRVQEIITVPVTKQGHWVFRNESVYIYRNSALYWLGTMYLNFILKLKDLSQCDDFSKSHEKLTHFR